MATTGWSQGVPSNMQPLTMSSGLVSQPWYQFLITLWTRTGGGDGFVAPLSVGSTVMCQYTGTATLLPGDNIAASNLVPNNYNTTISDWVNTGDTLEGTWRAQQTTGQDEISLFVRVS